MLRFVFIALLLAPHAAAQYASDAFGILPENAVGEERANWGRGEKPAAVHLYFGAKSLIAGREKAHVAALVFDENGNLVRTDDQTQFYLGEQLAAAPVFDGLADILFDPGTYANSFSASAEIGGIQSERVVYRVVPDHRSIKPKFDAALQFVPESFDSVPLATMRDQYGNLVADGTSVSIVFKHEDGRHSSLASLAIGGQANIPVLVRDLESAVSATVRLSNNQDTQSVSILTPRLNQNLSTRLTPIPELQAMKLEIGPLTTSAGHFVNDGVPVDVTITTQEDQIFLLQTWPIDGMVSLSLPISPSDLPIRVSLKSEFGAFKATLKESE